MLKSSLPWIVVAVAALAIAVSGRVSAQDPVSTSPSPGIKKWEYLVVDVDDKGGDEERRTRLLAQLTPLGQQGWEMISMPQLKGIRYTVIVMKRPAP
jgi:hypothetical protein